MALPNPGSDAAVMMGCTCPVADNGRGRGRGLPGGQFWYSIGCPVHTFEAVTTPDQLTPKEFDHG